MVICAYYLDKAYEPQYILVDLKEVYRFHAGANIAEIMKLILIEMIFLKRLRFF
jgi:hypothetical protein